MLPHHHSRLPERGAVDVPQLHQVTCIGDCRYSRGVSAFAIGQHRLYTNVTFRSPLQLDLRLLAASAQSRVTRYFNTAKLGCDERQGDAM